MALFQTNKNLHPPKGYKNSWW